MQKMRPHRRPSAKDGSLSVQSSFFRSSFGCLLDHLDDQSTPCCVTSQELQQLERSDVTSFSGNGRIPWPLVFR